MVYYSKNIWQGSFSVEFPQRGAMGFLTKRRDITEVVAEINNHLSLFFKCRVLILL